MPTAPARNRVSAGPAAHIEARALAEHLRVCALRAISAVCENDTRALEDALRGREDLMSRLERLLAPRPAEEPPLAGSDESLRDLLAALRATQAADARLTEELTRRRDEAADSLLRLSRGAQGGYGDSQLKAQPRIDERR